MRKLSDVEPNPCSRIGKDKDGDIGNTQLVAGHKGVSSQLFIEHRVQSSTLGRVAPGAVGNGFVRDVAVEVTGLAQHGSVPGGLPREPRELGPVFGGSEWGGDSVVLVEFTGEVEETGAAFEDGGGCAVFLDVDDGWEASVGVDGCVPI